MKAHFLKILNQKLIGYIVLGLIVVFSSSLMSEHLTEGHDWGGDFALYLDQAQALVKGELTELYQKNKFTVDYSSRLQGPYLYPMGYPLLLSPLVAKIGLNFFWLKVYTILFFFAALTIIYFYYQRVFKDVFLTLLILLLIAFNDSYLFHGDQLLSDFPFFFFTFLSFSLFQKEMSTKRQILVACTIFFAFLIRDLGAILLVSLLLHQITSISWKKLIKTQWITYVVFAGLFLLAFLIFPFGSKNHYDLFVSTISWETIQSNWEYYLSIYEMFFRGAENQTWLLYALLTLFSIGLLMSIKKHIALVSFFVFSSMILLLWPYHQSIRFLFPLIPLLLFFIFIPFNTLNVKWRRYLVYPILLLGAYFYLEKSLDLNSQNLKLEANQVYQEENIQLYNYVNENYSKSDTVVFFKPRVLRVFCGLNTVFLEPYKFKESQYRHLIIYKPWTDNEGLEELSIQKDFKNFRVYSK